MERLYKGVLKFQESYFKKEEEFFKRLSKGQDPEVLFITCSDSRVDPHLVTQSGPGELFILRNIGNIIPPFDALKDKNSTAAAIEYAVQVLNVTDIIVCGHSNCGAMKALLRDESELEGMPHLRDWLKLAGPVREHVLGVFGDSESEVIQGYTEKENILEQIENIETYPFVDAAIKAGKLFLHGWYFDIATGEMYAYAPGTNRFEEIK
ncbi:MAG: carbonic anhydrase [Deltaproteobacteria bacterium]|nr:carbonic anhydrase [Deltaproteobacteria bacterium]